MMTEVTGGNSVSRTIIMTGIIMRTVTAQEETGMKALTIIQEHMILMIRIMNRILILRETAEINLKTGM
jgi:hypothetical protein